MSLESERVRKWQEKNRKDCPSCGNKIYYRSKTCRNCFKKNKDSEKIKNMTLGEFRNKNKIKGRHHSWVYVEVRAFARSWNKSLRKNPCQNCGYKKHVELCHIIPLSSFGDDIKLREVNNLSNILVLCPNCHWEFDNGFLQINFNKKRKE